MKVRKQLKIQMGSAHEPEPEPFPKGPSKDLKDVQKGKMFRKFFQTGDDDDDGSLSHQESQLDDRGINPAELWDGVSGASLDCRGLSPLSLVDSLLIAFARGCQPGSRPSSGRRVCAEGGRNIFLMS
jgi:hypothetical protein